MSSLRNPTARYSVSQLGRIFGVTARALRFYEERGLINPGRDQQRRRIYSRRDYQRIRVIAGARKAGLSLEHIGELLDLYEPGDAGKAQLGKALERLRDRLADLDAQRDRAALTLNAAEALWARLPQPGRGALEDLEDRTRRRRAG
jgi:DNA-binding transcriptional MerR regulator